MDCSINELINFKEEKRNPGTIFVFREDIDRDAPLKINKNQQKNGTIDKGFKLVERGNHHASASPKMSFTIDADNPFSPRRPAERSFS